MPRVESVTGNTLKDFTVKAVAVIPARYASRRFPGKALVPLAGQPMIQRVYERVCRAQHVFRTLVATDDERISKAVEAFGGEVVLTRSDHRSGTEGVAEVAASAAGAEVSIYVNVQGDEPLIEPGAIDAAIAALASVPEVQVATLGVAIARPAEIHDPNVVKVVVDSWGDALYFSRAPIPWVRDALSGGRSCHWKHVGLYVFRRNALLQFPHLPVGELERLERLEQLRWLENGYKIRVIETSYDAISVDVPEDAGRVEKLLQQEKASRTL